MLLNMPGPPEPRTAEDVSRFEDLSYEDFRRMAQDRNLTGHEKVGFPRSYRAGKEQAILEDMIGKAPALAAEAKLIVELGPGCSPLAELIVDLCRANGHRLVLVDSPEMLAQLSDHESITKVPGRFPHEARLEEFGQQVDAVIVYSVFHYVFAEGNAWEFVDRALELLAPGGTLLLGDIPNVSKRRRFFSSEAGVEFHRAYTGAQTQPEVTHLTLEHGRIDDAVVLGIVARARAAGFDAFVVAQPADLPMANRREDIVVVRP